MCEFVSWIEHKGEILFLDADKLKTRRGKELIDHTVDPKDLLGRGAICWYYNIDRKDCVQKECEDFSTPNNFPAEIVSAIKEGKMRGFGYPEGLLNAPAQKILDETCAQAQKILKETYAPARKIFNETYAQARKISKETCAPAQKIFDETCNNVFWDLFADVENRKGDWK